VSRRARRARHHQQQISFAAPLCSLTLHFACRNASPASALPVRRRAWAAGVLGRPAPRARASLPICGFASVPLPPRARGTGSACTLRPRSPCGIPNSCRLIACRLGRLPMYAYLPHTPPCHTQPPSPRHGRHRGGVHQEVCEPGHDRGHGVAVGAGGHGLHARCVGVWVWAIKRAATAPRVSHLLHSSGAGACADDSPIRCALSPASGPPSP
jgi:hypothetical protein